MPRTAIKRGNKGEAARSLRSGARHYDPGDETASGKLRPALDRVIDATRSGSPPVVELYSRLIELVHSLVTRLDEKDVDQALAAGSDLETLVAALGQPALANWLRRENPLLPARIRGLKARAALARSEGGLLSREEVVSLLGIERAAVDRLRRTHKLLAVPGGPRTWAYPAWQFVDSRTLPGLESVIRALGDLPPWAAMRFFLSSHVRLGGARAIDALREHRVEEVERAARTFGEQGAA